MVNGNLVIARIELDRADDAHISHTIPDANENEELERENSDSEFEKHVANGAEDTTTIDNLCTIPQTPTPESVVSLQVEVACSGSPVRERESSGGASAILTPDEPRLTGNTFHEEICRNIVHANICVAVESNLCEAKHDAAGDNYLGPPTSSPPPSSPPEVFTSSPVPPRARERSTKLDRHANRLSQSTAEVDVVPQPSSPIPRSSSVPENFDQDSAGINATNNEGSRDSLYRHIEANTPKSDPVSVHLDANQSVTLKAVASGIRNSGLKIDYRSSTMPSEPSPEIGVHKTRTLPPNPKRTTVASQYSQHKKLAKPFRTPTRVNIAKEKVTTQNDTLPSKTTSIAQPLGDDPAPELDSRLRHRSARAGAQFKSPLVKRDLPSNTPSVRLTPAIQTLERQLNLLQRAIKIKQDKDENILQELVNKWTEAGREAAWELWNLVKDTNHEDSPSFEKRRFREDWGWPEQPYTKKVCEDSDILSTHGQNEREDVIQSALEDEEIKEKRGLSLGTMLHQLGIASETLGWNDTEEEFQQED
ncbi:hypothetical protein AX16_000208 [Volvariella volvacea WC 439]|nr:hypothetical protein AX16_000208 [Volvariella volvacea WC 439]